MVNYATQEIIWITVSACSTAASFSVLMSGVLFPGLRREFYFRLILMISLCDFFSNLIGTWGFPHDEETCTAQALMIFIFLPAVWLWCTVLSCTMYFHIDHGRVYVSFFQMNIIVWCIVLICIAICIPYLSDGEFFYGCHKQFLGDQFGALRATDDSDDTLINDYTIGTFIAPCLCCIAIMILCVMCLQWITLPRIRRTDPNRVDRIIPLMRYISMFPIGLCIFWLPNMITFLATHSGRNGGYYHRSNSMIDANYITFYLGYGYGMYMAIVFFVNSKIARTSWCNLFKRCCGITVENPLLADLRDRESTESEQLTLSEVFTGGTSSRNTASTIAMARLTIFENSLSSVSTRNSRRISNKSNKSARSDKSSIVEVRLSDDNTGTTMNMIHTTLDSMPEQTSIEDDVAIEIEMM